MAEIFYGLADPEHASDCVFIQYFCWSCFGLWIDSFFFWGVRPMKAIKNSTPFSLSSLYFAICPIWP